MPMVVPSNGVSVTPATKPTSVELPSSRCRGGAAVGASAVPMSTSKYSTCIPTATLIMSLNLKPSTGVTLTDFASASRWLNIPTHGVSDVVLNPYGALKLIPKYS